MPSKPITDPRAFYVYVLFRDDGITPFYVGKGKGRRWLAHERRAHNNENHKDRIISGMRDRGIEIIPKAKLAEGLTDEESRRIERHMIALWGREPVGPLVNQTRGGDGPRNPSAEVRAKLGARSRNPSAATREKMRQAKLGKPWSAETRANLNRPPRSAETRAKIGASLRGRKLSAESRALIGAKSKAQPMTAKRLAILADARAKRVVTEQMREKWRENIKKAHTEEIHRRTAEMNRGKKRSEESKRKIREALLALPQEVKDRRMQKCIEALRARKGTITPRQLESIAKARDARWRRHRERKINDSFS